MIEKNDFLNALLTDIKTSNKIEKCKKVIAKSKLNKKEKKKIYYILYSLYD